MLNRRDAVSRIAMLVGGVFSAPTLFAMEAKKAGVIAEAGNGQAFPMGSRGLHTAGHHSERFDRRQAWIQDLRTHPLELDGDRDLLAAAEQMGDAPFTEGAV